MPLWVSVGITVVLVLIVIGALGVAIDKSARE